MRPGTVPALVPLRDGKPLPQIYLSNTKHGMDHIFGSDGAHGSRFKWLVSTCLAGAVGLGAIGIVMYASMDMEDGSGMLASIQSASMKALKPFKPTAITNNNLHASIQKTDRIEMSALGLSTQHIIHDSVIQKRGDREFISIKPYARIVARLSTSVPAGADNIPTFNPFKLYSNPAPIASGKKNASAPSNQGITTRIVSLQEGVLPDEDGESLTPAELNAILASAAEFYNDESYAIRPGIIPKGDTQQELDPGASQGLFQNVALKSGQNLNFAQNITEIEKSTAVEEAIESREVKTAKIRKGDTLAGLLNGVGAEPWQIKAIIEAMNPSYKASAIKRGQTIRFTLVPSPLGQGKMEPIAVSLFARNTHLITVFRNDGGDYVASKNPLDLAVANTLRPALQPKRATVYTSLYASALAQNIPPEKIIKLLKIHAYDVDFKRRVQPGDSFEAFYDLEEKTNGEEVIPKELLFTSVSVGGINRAFYRFRSPGGMIDYYDDKGSSSKKFLMRKPVRGARYASKFGYRIHPISRRRKMHTGTDWAAPRGTPILAAGNGVVEAAGRKGGYGNYIRIRHANGYKTAYAHIHHFAKGLRVGAKVRQGQVIAYVGSTGASTGPHLHFEVLVNNRHVDPMKIEVPSGEDLKGRLLAQFHKEKGRIDELMHRSPVKTRIAPMSRSASNDTEPDLSKLDAQALQMVLTSQSKNAQ